MTIQITTEQIKELRDSTGISVMQCKRALEEAEGNMDKALAILKKTSGDIALKKGNREVNSGAVMIKATDKKAVISSLLCETDFVSKNEDFTNLLSKLTDISLTKGIEEMKKEATEMVNQIIQKTGENIVLGDFFEVSLGNSHTGETEDVLGTYVHNNKSGVIVRLEGGNSELAKDIAMHITAMKPEYITREEIAPDAVKMITEVFEKEIASVDKPVDIKKKMLDGKIATYFKEKTLLDQVFIKNTGEYGDETVGKLLERSKAKIKEVKRHLI